MENNTSTNHENGNDAKLPVVGSAFSDKQKQSLIYTVRFIIDHTRRYDKELSDEEIIRMIEEDLFGE